MNNRRCFFPLLAILLLMGCTLPLTAEEKPPKDEAEAEKWVKEGLDANERRTLGFSKDGQGLVSVSWTNRDGKSGVLYLFMLKSITPVQLESGLWTVHYSFSGDKLDYWEHLGNRDRVERYREGLLFLAHESQKHWDELAAQKLDAFDAQADAWRALAVKPKMPDDAYAHKVLAEDAYRNKDLVKALDEYQLGIQVFPTWPEGQFNAALIAAELEIYRVAVQRMKEYLLLAPDAPAAKDKIIIWRDKIVSF
jgi:tetratricopeptide (TPR) repeat protein